tara:strand:+ start:1398 stop:1619 length:222 start_codon:yes stop_codon:yes gene_type:complete
VTLKNEVIYGLVSQLEDGQILNYMETLSIDKLVHLASFLREMQEETGEIRYRRLIEAAMQSLHALGITLTDEV